MMAAGHRGVVLLHGLYDPPDPFLDLQPIEGLLSGNGFIPLKFEWPTGFNPALCLASPRRSFSGELAPQA